MGIRRSVCACYRTIYLNCSRFVCTYKRYMIDDPHCHHTPSNKNMQSLERYARALFIGIPSVQFVCSDDDILAAVSPVPTLLRDSLRVWVRAVRSRLIHQSHSLHRTLLRETTYHISMHTNNSLKHISATDLQSPPHLYWYWCLRKLCHATFWPAARA